jgi:hypothetical protein
MAMRDEDDDLDPGWEHNLAVVSGWDRYRWMSWFLAAVDERGPVTEPLRLDSRATIAAEVSELYKLVRENVRRPMREGVADALAAWNRTHHSLGILTSLGYIAAALQAPEALPKLLEIMRVQRGLLTSSDEEEIIVAEILLSVIGGYPYDAHVEAMFSDLLMDNTVARELSALLALTVCKAKPHRFVECFNRYYDRRHEPEEFFDDESIVAAFAYVVPIAIRNPLVAQLSFGASALWMQAGKMAAVVASHEIVPPDAEGRPNDTAADAAIPPRATPSFDEAVARYAAGFDDPDEILDEVYDEAREEERAA